MTTVDCETFHALLPNDMVLYVQQYSGPVNEKRLSALPGQTSQHSARNKICAHSISSSWNRSGTELRQATESHLGSPARGRATDELSQFSQDSIAQQKSEKTNRDKHLGKTAQPSEARGLRETEVERVEERDPLANLKLLEENRPGFHWRSAKSLNALVHGTEDSNDKNKR